MVLFRQSLVYLWARGLPSLLSFAALALYTRLLTPDEFGIYAMVMAGVYLANSASFQWLRMSLLRFAGKATDHRQLLSTALAGYGLLLGLTALVAMPILAFTAEAETRNFILCALLLLWLNAGIDLNLTLMQARLEAIRYGLTSVARSILTITVAAVLAFRGWGVWSLLIGHAVGTALPSLFFVRSLWTEVGIRHVSGTVMRRLMRYGVPLTASLSLSFIVRGSDRLLLGLLVDNSIAGVYAAAYDLANNSLEVLMGVVSTAAFPLAVHALEQNGVEAARAQLSQNVSALVAVALPAAVGLAFVAPGISMAFLGASFQDDATQLIPWVALGVLLSGIRAYYVDHAFQLGTNTLRQFYVLALAACTNILLNLLLIPVFGALGAAYATVGAYAVGLIAGIWLSREVFVLPLPRREILKIVLATAGMVLLLWPLRSLSAPFGLAAQVSIGAFAYITLLFLLNALQIRSKVLDTVLRSGRAT